MEKNHTYEEYFRTFKNNVFKNLGVRKGIGDGSWQLSLLQDDQAIWLSLFLHNASCTTLNKTNAFTETYCLTSIILSCVPVYSLSKDLFPHTTPTNHEDIVKTNGRLQLSLY